MGNLIAPSGQVFQVVNEGDRRELEVIGTDATLMITDIVWLAGYFARDRGAQPQCASFKGEARCGGPAGHEGQHQLYGERWSDG